MPRLYFRTPHCANQGIVIYSLKGGGAMEGTQQAKEQAYLRRARELGRAFGDSPELSQLCREAYQEYRRGGISSAAYNAIYTVCLEYAQPR